MKNLTLMLQQKAISLQASNWGGCSIVFFTTIDLLQL